MLIGACEGLVLMRLNESPSEKEGKYAPVITARNTTPSLNESPSEKEGKYQLRTPLRRRRFSLNESPSEKEGKYRVSHSPRRLFPGASMKALPKRKGNVAGLAG